MSYDRVTRILHAFIAISIVVQLIASALMITPRPGRMPNDWWEIHENLGLLIGAVLVLHWLWSIRTTILSGESYRLFPWFSSALRRDLVTDLRETVAEAKAGRLAHAEKSRPLPAAVEGLGLLVASWLALTGFGIELSMTETGAVDPSLFFIRDLHGLAGNLMWAYLIAHPAMAILHEVFGHRTLRQMFRFGR